MFYIHKKVNEGMYEVADTSDDSIELHSVEEIRHFESLGLKIKGVDEGLVYTTTSARGSKYTGDFIRDAESRECVFRGKDWEKVGFSDYTRIAIKPDGELSKRPCVDMVVLRDGVHIGSEFAPQGRCRVHGYGLAVVAFDVAMYRADYVRSRIMERNERYKRTGEFSVDAETGLALPLKPFDSGTITVSNLGNPDLTCDNTPVVPDVDFIKSALRLYRLTLVERIRNKKSVPIQRVIKSTGISYKVVCESTDSGSYSVVKSVALEDMFNNPSKYDGVVLDGDSLYVEGLDGVYRYEKPLVSHFYKNFISNESVKISAKSKLMGLSGDMTFTEKGDLVSINPIANKIVIPSGIFSLNGKSVPIGHNLKSIKISKDVKSCARNAFFLSGSVSPDTLYLDVQELDFKLICTVLSSICRCFGSSNRTTSTSRKIIPVVDSSSAPKVLAAIYSASGVETAFVSTLCENIWDAVAKMPNPREVVEETMRIIEHDVLNDFKFKMDALKMKKYELYFSSMRPDIHTNFERVFDKLHAYTVFLRYADRIVGKDAYLKRRNELSDIYNNLYSSVLERMKVLCEDKYRLGTLLYELRS